MTQDTRTQDAGTQDTETQDTGTRENSGAGPQANPQAPQARAGATPLFNPAEAAELNNRNMEFAARAARAYFNGATRLNQHMIDFVNARVKKDMETARALVTSKNSSDIFHAQSRFLEDAVRDYADEASKVFHLAAEITRETLAPMEKRTGELLEAIDSQAELQERKASEAAE